MNSELAERVLVNVMEWDEETVARERPLIQVLASYKFDEYQQFSPGMRFIESFASWLRQFDKDERNIMYNFVKCRLIYIANTEMQHFVSIVYPDIIRKILFGKVAQTENMSTMDVKTLSGSTAFELIRRKSLFLGLSDGARMDFFRRINQGSISNEQIWLTYEISNEKAQGMLKDLSEDLEHKMGRKPSDSEVKFKTIFLLDDFSASGTSYFRVEKEKFTGRIKKTGKIIKILEKFFPQTKEDYDKNSIEYDYVSNLVDPNNLEIHVILYLMTEDARQKLNSVIEEWIHIHKLNVIIKIHPVQLIKDPSKIKIDTDSKLLDIIKKPAYFDKGIIDSHWEKGRCKEPYLGYDQCSLPLVMSHNAPNNALPILWFESFRSVKGLFPRISRHKKE